MNDFTVAKDPDTPPEELSELYKKGVDEMVETQLALNPSTPESVLFAMAQNDGFVTRRALAKRDFLTETVFEALLEDPRMFTTLAENETLTEDMMLALAHLFPSTQRALSTNANATDKVLNVLTDSRDPITLNNIITHPHTLPDTYNTAYNLLPPSDKEKYEERHFSMGDILADDRDAQLEMLDDKDVTENAISIMATSPHDDVRRKILSLPKIPYTVLVTLAKDEVPDIAELASQLLMDDDLS